MSCFAWGVSDDRALLIQRALKNKPEWTRWCILITDVVVSRRPRLDFSYSFPDSQTCTEQFYPSGCALYPKLSWECSEKWVLLLLTLDVSFERLTGERPAAFAHNFLLLRENPSLHGLGAPCLLLKPFPAFSFMRGPSPVLEEEGNFSSFPFVRHEMGSNVVRYRDLK